LSRLTFPPAFATVQPVSEHQGHPGKRLPPTARVCLLRALPWVLGCWLCAGLAARAQPLTGTDSPIGFFTNVANRLLQSQLGLSLNHIQIFPTNQYTPAVHRLLQLSANLYDASTNRTTTGYPYLPSVFRPVFTRASGRATDEVFLSGYREITPTDTMNLVARYDAVRDLSDPIDLMRFDPTSDMVYGIPLIIGARKGLPNFNEFAMTTTARVARKLQFHRPGTSTTAPVNEIDQMFLLALASTLGVEAWNSYAATYPRNLELIVWPDISVVLTNLETGKWLNSPPLSSSYRLLAPIATNIAPNTWAGYDASYERVSFKVPLATNLVFLTNATYNRLMDAFTTSSSAFERTPGTTNFYVPQWQITVKARLRVILLDTDSEQIVDYVNLASTQDTNLTAALATDGTCGDPYAPDGSNGSMWCTNRLFGVTADSVPTCGIQNQLEVCLGPLAPADWGSFIVDALPGMGDVSAARTFFRGQFMPGYPHASNTFNAPFQPFRSIYLLTSWQANDPLVHYMLSDLIDPSRVTIALDTLFPSAPDPTTGLSRVNARYQPWGGNPSGMPGSVTAYDLTVKDPASYIQFALGSSDAWDFPTNQTPDARWLGRIHRGTPWQTIYLKAPATDLSTWQQWTGDNQLLTNGNSVTLDAALTHPTNDWRLATLLLSLLSTNAPRDLHSVNQSGVPAWRTVLDGLLVFTNTPDWEFDSVLMQSNSSQALTIATALSAAQSSQPGHYFHYVSDILATPELSTACPWFYLDPDYPNFSPLTEAAYEAIPAQLLSLLRPDSAGSVRQVGGALQFQFTGLDPWAYQVQTSSNLVNWTSLSTNYPTNGAFTFTATLPPGSNPRFYRSVLLP
jgi:hypothetical protein